MEFPATDSTRLLQAARAGGGNATNALFEQLYDELRRLAHTRLRDYRPGATLQTTGLVHEAYLRLVDHTRATEADRGHFLALAARAMKFVLLDRARARGRLKRGGPQADVPLDAVQVAADQRAAELLMLDEALERLRGHSERLAEVVDYRFFGGLTYPEMAEATGRSVATLERDWARARLWLFRALDDEPAAVDGENGSPESGGPENGSEPARGGARS